MSEYIRQLTALIQERPDLPVVCLIEGAPQIYKPDAETLGQIGPSRIGEYTQWEHDVYTDRHEFAADYFSIYCTELEERFGYQEEMRYPGERHRYTGEEREANDAALERVENHIYGVADRFFRPAIIVEIRREPAHDITGEEGVRDEDDNC